MPFAPVVPLGGLAGWRVLQRTLPRQQEQFNKSADLQREVQYFKDNIENVTTTAEFVGDRRLLAVALGAFGLSDEVNKQAFVRKVLDEGTFDPQSFANRLGNSDYLEFAKTFSFGDEGGFVPTTNRINKITDDFLTLQFEEAVGDVDPSMRLALNFKREMTELASRDISENAGWFLAMGSEPVRKVLEGLFNLPTEFAQIDIDQQKDVLIDKAKLMFGESSVKLFTDPANLDKAINQFQLREQINNGPNASTPGFAALALFGGGGFGSQSILNLLISNT